jgi:hypothetical protein
MMLYYRFITGLVPVYYRYFYIMLPVYYYITLHIHTSECISSVMEAYYPIWAVDAAVALWTTYVSMHAAHAALDWLHKKTVTHYFTPIN